MSSLKQVSCFLAVLCESISYNSGAEDDYDGTNNA